jgi:hypothetical protein
MDGNMPTNSDPWSEPHMRRLREAIRVCLAAGERYRELKDMLATEDELYQAERQRQSEGER